MNKYNRVLEGLDRIEELILNDRKREVMEYADHLGKTNHLLTDPSVHIQKATYHVSNGICRNGRVLFIDNDEAFCVWKEDPECQIKANLKVEKCERSDLVIGDICYMANFDRPNRRFDDIYGFHLIIDAEWQVCWRPSGGISRDNQTFTRIWKVVI